MPHIHVTGDANNSSATILSLFSSRIYIFVHVVRFNIRCNVAVNWHLLRNHQTFTSIVWRSNRFASGVPWSGYNCFYWLFLSVVLNLLCIDHSERAVTERLLSLHKSVQPGWS